MHVPAAAREEHRRLAGRVAAADDDHFLALADLRLEVRRRVVDALADEAREVLDRDRPVLRAGRDDDRPRVHDAAVRRARSGRAGGSTAASPPCSRPSRPRRTSAPGRPRGRRAPGPRCRSGSRGSSRSSSSFPPVRPAPCVSSTSTSRPSDAPYTAAASPAGPAPITMRSRTVEWSISGLMPQAFGEAFVARIPQHHLAAADDHRHFVDADVEALEHRRHVRVAIDVDAHVRKAVAGEELAAAGAWRPSGSSRSG